MELTDNCVHLVKGIDFFVKGIDFLVVVFWITHTVFKAYYWLCTQRTVWDAVDLTWDCCVQGKYSVLLLWPLKTLKTLKMPIRVDSMGLSIISLFEISW